MLENSHNQETDAAWRFHNATKYVRPEGDLREVEVRILMGVPPRLGPGIGEQDRHLAAGTVQMRLHHL